MEGKRLLPEAAQAWRELAGAARADGIALGLISAYRSVSDQRGIFLYRLRTEALGPTGKPYTHAEIAEGTADAAVDHILKTSSIPGYSKHHTGYTIDITDLTSGRVFTRFRETQGFAWISADNYLNAKRFGFIPSYPEGAGFQGPEPEAWEYCWVGTEVLAMPPLPGPAPEV